LIRILCVGKLKAPHFQSACEDYHRRLRRFTKMEIVEIGDSAPESEATEMARHLKSAPFVACDERGELWSSHDMARWLGKHGSTDFLLGGPAGLDPDLRERAAQRVAFGRITLPHELARVVLLEQLYRGYTILQGHPYHR